MLFVQKYDVYLQTWKIKKGEMPLGTKINHIVASASTLNQITTSMALNFIELIFIDENGVGSIENIFCRHSESSSSLRQPLDGEQWLFSDFGFWDGG